MAGGVDARKAQLRGSVRCERSEPVPPERERPPISSSCTPQTRRATFTRGSIPVRQALGGGVTAAADGSPTLWAACPTGTMAEVFLSRNGGRTWVVASGGFPNSLGLAAASSSVALAWPGQQISNAEPPAMDRTTNGARSYSGALYLSAASEVLWAGFSDPSRAYALVRSGNLPTTTTRLYESEDGGKTWHEVAIRS